MSHVLIVDDDANTREALAALCETEGFTTAVAGSVAEARIQLVRQRPDVVLMDLKLPDGSGMDLFEDLEDRTSIETILITGHASVETAVEALRLGASDYLTKPINYPRLKAILSRVPKSGELRAEIGHLRDELRRMGRFGRLVGRSPAMQELYDRIARVAPTEATVFLVGESGTGKEVVARTIHDLSRRRSQPFLAINCGAISPNLIENEMFGHERGSYTGADRQHKGYFEQAHGGTLLLDEITEMPPELQVRLLRVLETGQLMRIGTSRPVETDVRIIAATNRDPMDALRSGKLREDLYHRLNVFPLALAPLRERGDDIELVANHFLSEMNDACGTRKKFAPGAVARMKQHPWPGNVRELKNFIHREYIMAGEEGIEGPTLEMPSAPVRTLGTATSSTPSITVPLGTPLSVVARELILSTLEHCGGERKRTAEMLGICTKTLYNRLREYGIRDEHIRATLGRPGRLGEAMHGIGDTSRAP
ncbi:MAG TPA: sigma-54 dependent transcriptional regulator [Usitatibacter sp.]|jgi:DNA-binding NtrC family response regulator|nr:sigma-54 dependent transcriptional regulator [Usitatibacter sp.]